MTLAVRKLAISIASRRRPTSRLVFRPSAGRSTCSSTRATNGASAESAVGPNSATRRCGWSTRKTHDLRRLRLMCLDAARLPASSAATATVARFCPTILPPVGRKMIRIRNGSRNEANFCSEINRGRNEDSRRRSPDPPRGARPRPGGATLHSRRRDVLLHGRRSYQFFSSLVHRRRNNDAGDPPGHEACVLPRRHRPTISAREQEFTRLLAGGLT